MIFLAIEEPELFQHPAQAKAFSSVLRDLAQDEIAIHTVFENDRGIKARMIAHPKKPKDPKEIERDALAQEKANALENRKLLRYFKHAEEDWPAGQLSASLTVIDDTIESVIDKDWQAFGTEWDRLTAAGVVANDKDAAMYRRVAKAATGVPIEFDAVIASVRALAP